MNILMVAGIIAGVSAALVVASSWVFARLWCKPQRIIPDATPDDYHLPFEPVRFISKGIMLNGWFIPAGDAFPRPVIIAPHGWSSNASAVLPLAKLLHEAGYAVLLYHSRGHGDSGNDGPITILKFAEDIISGIDYLETRRDVDTERLGVVGHSLGASATILAASMDVRIRVAASSSAFSDPVQLTRETMRKLHLPRGPWFRLVAYFIERWLGTGMESVAPKNVIGKVEAHLLLVHGDADRFVDPGNLDVLYFHSNRERTTRRMIGGAGHASIIRYLSYDDNLLLRYFDEHLMQDPCPIHRDETRFAQASTVS